MVVAVALLIGFGAYWSWKKEKQRALELGGWAAHEGFRFSPTRDPSMDGRYPLFSALRQGSNRYAYNVMHGRRKDRDACCFDYHYETYSTDSKGRRQTHHHHFSATLVETDLPLKGLFLRPEGFFDKIAEFAGFDDIDFESAEFSRSFLVKSKDKRWAFDVLHQATIEFLLQAPRFHVELAGPYVMVWRASRFKAVDFSGSLYVADGILDRLPKYLIQDLKGAGP
jgi:hypothetical protein